MSGLCLMFSILAGFCSGFKFPEEKVWLARFGQCNHLTQRKTRHFERTLRKQIGMLTSLNTINVLCSGLDPVSFYEGILQEAKRNHWRILNSGWHGWLCVSKPSLLETTLEDGLGEKVVRGWFNSWGKNIYLKIWHLENFEIRGPIWEIKKCHVTDGCGD